MGFHLQVSNMGAKKSDPKGGAKGGKTAAKPKKDGAGGKAKKKKWSKGKVRDKLNTPSVVSERLKVRGSLAKQALRELCGKGLIRLISAHSSQMIYTRATKADAE